MRHLAQGESSKSNNPSETNPALTPASGQRVPGTSADCCPPASQRCFPNKVYCWRSSPGSKPLQGGTGRGSVRAVESHREELLDPDMPHIQSFRDLKSPQETSQWWRPLSPKIPMGVYPARTPKEGVALGHSLVSGLAVLRIAASEHQWVALTECLLSATSFVCIS